MRWKPSIVGEAAGADTFLDLREETSEMDEEERREELLGLFQGQKCDVYNWPPFNFSFQNKYEETRGKDNRKIGDSSYFVPTKTRRVLGS